MDVLIQARNLSIGYGSHKKEKEPPILSNVNLALPAGGIYGLVGANGQGKTTLLRALAGQLAVQGELRVFGQTPFDNAHVLDRTVFMGIDTELPNRKVSQIFAMCASRWVNWSAELAQKLVEDFAVPMDKDYKELSRGQRSSVGFIIALASGCPLVLLDEPYLGLDVEKQEKLYAALRNYRSSERTFIMATHQLAQAQPILDHIVLIDAGTVALSADISELLGSIFEIRGTKKQVAAALSPIPSEFIVQETHIVSGSKALIDLRKGENLIPDLIQGAHESGAALREVTLEQVITLMTGDSHDS
ncbi:ABC transporter ATP-binding protein [Corynebacterium sp. sy017]|uniref:ATP-binding cassette domain-containing protein n=1 Tax=unclassified Corynebacterium TaxID=2624378 RepID=UPI001185567E|nr:MULTISPECIES: ABC transporter ATP-binding protein [unclassified Corynebacterium]MBP3088206.1 ABC transporter ATP-binding protein [Corynebacterium sp. sy017]TSD91540.1 ABC transporter ATP-binding protein [Corynebacterium sp. SY003]